MHKTDGFPGKTVLSEKAVPLDWSKHGELLDSYLSFQLNRKSLLTKITASMEAVATLEGFYTRTLTLLLVDAWDHPKLPEETRLIIDKDLCEI